MKIILGWIVLGIALALAYYLITSYIAFWAYNYIAQELHWTILSFWTVLAINFLAHMIAKYIRGRN